MRDILRASPGFTGIYASARAPPPVFSFSSFTWCLKGGMGQRITGGFGSYGGLSVDNQVVVH